jgi:peptidoglycan/LPS O-acetylase OafA/YrhL
MSQINFFYIPIPAKRIYGLDILRAFAILGVMLAHSSSFLPAQYRDTYLLFVLDSVSIFFVLSGFLIGGILIKTLETQKGARHILLDFWIKRWFRTIPPYFLVLILVIACNWSKPNFKITYFKEYFVFLQNFKSPHPFFFDEAWSISVEEWFYLLIPSATILLIMLRIRAKAALLSVAILVVVAVTVYRYYKYLHFPPATGTEWDLNFRKIVITRLDSLMYGVIAAYLSYYDRQRWLIYKLFKFIAGVSLLLFAQFTSTFQGLGLNACVFSFSIISVATMLLLPFLASLTKGSGWSYRLLTRISLISYSMYLLNLNIGEGAIVTPLLNYFALKGSVRNAVGYLLFWAVTILLATLMYNYFEVPIMRLRNKLVSTRKQSKEPAPA